MKGWISRLGRRPRKGQVEVLQLEQMALRLRNQIAEEGVAIREVQRAQVATLEKLARETHVIAAALRCMVNMRVVESLHGDIGSMADPREILAMAAGESQTVAPHDLVPKRDVRELTSAGMAFSAWLEELRGVGFPQRYIVTLTRNVFEGHCNPSLPSDTDDVLGWLEQLAIGNVIVRQFGEIGQAALLEALRTLKRTQAGGE